MSSREIPEASRASASLTRWMSEVRNEPSSCAGRIPRSASFRMCSTVVPDRPANACSPSPSMVRHGIGVRERPRIGDAVEHRITVTPEMTARLFDREVHPVYATAWMVRHVEEAGRLLVEPPLEAGEDATGYSIELTHERSASVGETLTVLARVTDVDERRCTARFEVHGEAGVVGRGTFVQRYVSRGRLG